MLACTLMQAGSEVHGWLRLAVPLLQQPATQATRNCAVLAADAASNSRSGEGAGTAAVDGAAASVPITALRLGAQAYSPVAQAYCPSSESAVESSSSGTVQQQQQQQQHGHLTARADLSEPFLFLTTVTATCCTYWRTPCAAIMRLSLVLLQQQHHHQQLWRHLHQLQLQHCSSSMIKGHSLHPARSCRVLRRSQPTRCCCALSMAAASAMAPQQTTAPPLPCKRLLQAGHMEATSFYYHRTVLAPVAAAQAQRLALSKNNHLAQVVSVPMVRRHDACKHVLNLHPAAKQETAAAMTMPVMKGRRMSGTIDLRPPWRGIVT
jgi:hypothetical protein